MKRKPPKPPWKRRRKRGPRTGRALRDEGIERVLNGSRDWAPRAQKVVLQLCETRSGVEMMGEDISAEIIAQIGAPHHSNALGGISSWYVRAGLVERVAEDHMRKPSSHARRTPVYRLVHPRDAKRGDDDEMAT